MLINKKSLFGRTKFIGARQFLYRSWGRYRHFEYFVPRLAVFLEDFVSDTADLATSPSVVNV